jgi:hypothetical protein
MDRVVERMVYWNEVGGSGEADLVRNFGGTRWVV